MSFQIPEARSINSDLDEAALELTLERDVGSPHGIHNVPSLLDTRVTPSAKLESKGPEWHGLCLPNDLGVLLVYVDSSWSSNEV